MILAMSTAAFTLVHVIILNTFVLVAQPFAKVPALKALAPTGSEPSFAVAERLVLVAFVALGVSAVRGFRPAAPLAA
ncbi:MAG TPA: hypothetical protein VFO23_11515 [Steroidobacteraceae bacterium]|nr:hypothetical protein [Steroidobacteraceae bacterium]